MSSWFFSPEYMANPSISLCLHATILLVRVTTTLSSALPQVSPYPFLLLKSILYTVAKVIFLIHKSDCHLLFSLERVPTAPKIKSKSLSGVKGTVRPGSWLPHQLHLPLLHRAPNSLIAFGNSLSSVKGSLLSTLPLPQISLTLNHFSRKPPSAPNLGQITPHSYHSIFSFILLSQL